MPYGSANKDKSYENECQLCGAFYWENNWKRNLCPTCSGIWNRESQ